MEEAVDSFDYRRYQQFISNSMRGHEGELGEDLRILMVVLRVGTLKVFQKRLAQMNTRHQTDIVRYD